MRLVIAGMLDDRDLPPPSEETRQVLEALVDALAADDESEPDG